MYLPHVDEAIVPERKISHYLLAVDHPTGRNKARFFRGLGFRQERPDILRRALLQHAASDAVSSIQQTHFGAKYLVDGRIRGPAGDTATIRSVWFVETGERSPRFTAYPLRGLQR